MSSRHDVYSAWRTAYLMPGAADDGREDGSRGVVTGEAGLAHAGAIVNYQCGYVIVTHFDWLVVVGLSTYNELLQ